MNYRNTPFLRIVLPFIAGILLADFFPFPAAPPLGSALCLAGAWCILWFSGTWKYAPAYRWIYGLCAQITLLAFGYLHQNCYYEHHQPTHFSKQTGADSTVWIQGMVNDMPTPGAKTKALLKVQYLQTDRQPPVACTGNLLVYINADTLRDTLAYGDVVRIRAALTPLQAPSNPHAFDYRNYLHHQNIHYSAFLQWADLEVISSGNGYAVWAKAYEYRDRLLQLLHHYFHTPDEYAVASALLVGYKEDLSDEIKAAYAETGSMHALAVSGTHVGLLYAGILFLLQRLPLRGRKGRLVETLIALAGIWAFTFITGATASVLRASVMFSTFLLGKMVYRQTNIWNVLGASAFVLLAYNPLMLFDAGFQLSYAAVVGMAFFYPLLYKVSPILPYAWMDAGWKVLLVGVAAQIGTLPLSLYYFHQFPCYFWLAGWVVVSGGAVFLWGGAVLILLDIFMPIGAGYLGYLLYYLTFWMNKIIFLIQDLPGAVWSGIWLAPLEAILLYGAIASIGAMVVWRHNRWVFATVICLLLLMAAQVNRTLDRLQTKAVCVYAVKKAVLIDVFDRGKRITIAEGVSERQEQFAAQSHRWAMGVDHRPGRGIGAARDTASGNVLLQNGLLRVGGLRLAMIGPHSIMPDTTLPVHAIVLSGNPEIPLERCIHSYPGSVIVADASNAHRSVRQWKAWCTERGIRFHDVKKEGAWRIEER